MGGICSKCLNETSPKRYQVSDNVHYATTVLNVEHHDGNVNTGEEESLGGDRVGRDQVGRQVINANTVVNVKHQHGNIDVGEGLDLNQLADEDYKSFLISLEQKQKEACTVKGVLKELNGVTIAPLQITMDAERHYTDDVDHYTHRDELVRLISEPPKGDISYEDLFEEARKFAKSETKTCLNQEAQQNQLDIEGNIVAISGQAGIGKTTLTKVILNEVTDKTKDICLYGSKIVFNLPFRSIDYKKETSLLQLLANSVDCSWMNDEKRRNAVMEKLLNQSEEILIIMDGLDEADVDWKSIPTTEVSIYQEEKPEVLIANILNGNILPKAKKLLTSRPRQLTELPDWLRPGFSVKILGLNKDAQKQICDEICKNNSQKVFDHIQDHSDLSSYCFVPVNCILVIHCVHQIMQFQTKSLNKIPLPTSMTMVLTLVLVKFIGTEQMRENELQTKKLSNLAWLGFSAKKLTFNEKDLRKANLDETTLNTFLVTIQEESRLPLLRGSYKSVTYFSHLLLQEFFVALNLLFFIDFEKFNSLFFETTDEHSFFNLNESRFEMVLKFLFGLCNTTTVKYLHEGISTCSFPLQQAEKLKDLARHNLEELGDLTDEKEKFKLVLRICSLAYEMQNKEFTEEVASLIKDQLRVEGEILSSDVACLFYVLKASKEPLTMTSYGNFHGDSFARFSEELKKTREIRKIEVNKISVRGISIEDVEATNLFSCLKTVKEMTFRHCKISKKGFAEICKEIKNLNEPMESLDFENTDVGDDEARHLSTCLKNIKELHLSGCRVTPIGMKEIAAEVGNLQTPMKLLDLSSYNFGDEDGVHLKEIVNNVESLMLHGCYLTGVTVESIARSLKNPMKLLDLSWNMFGDEGGIHLKEIVNNVESLKLDHCGLTGVTVASIARNLKKPMKCLDLHDNKFGNTGFIAISHCLSKISELYIGDEDDTPLTMEGINSLSSALQGLETPMEKLRVNCSYSIKEEVRKELQKCQSNVKDWDVTGRVNITIDVTLDEMSFE